MSQESQDSVDRELSKWNKRLDQTESSWENRLPLQAPSAPAPAPAPARPPPPATPNSGLTSYGYDLPSRPSPGFSGLIENRPALTPGLMHSSSANSAPITSEPDDSMEIDHPPRAPRPPEPKPLKKRQSTSPHKPEISKRTSGRIPKSGSANNGLVSSASAPAMLGAPLEAASTELIRALKVNAAIKLEAGQIVVDQAMMDSLEDAMDDADEYVEAVKQYVKTAPQDMVRPWLKGNTMICLASKIAKRSSSDWRQTSSGDEERGMACKRCAESKKAKKKPCLVIARCGDRQIILLLPNNDGKYKYMAL